MAIKFASGRDVASTPLLEAEFPFTLDPEIYKGAWVITSSGNTFYSNGSDWISTTSAGIEVFQPPWESTPDGWFDVAAAPPGDLADRGVIASKFDVSYVTPDAQTWPIVDPANLFSDDEGTTPVLSAPEPIGLLEDTTVPQINWFQDVSVDRPQWDQITRNGETVNVLKFDQLGQELKVDFPEAVSGTMVHVSSKGIYRAEVDIPVGEYTFGRWQPWDIEEIILLDRTLTESEYTQLKNELAKTRNRVTDITEDDWTHLFNSRSEVDLFSLPDVFAENPQVTSFSQTFVGNNLTSIPENLFDNTPNVTDFYRTFAFNNLTSIPDNLFDNTPNVTNFQDTFINNNLSSIPAGLFDNTPNVTTFRKTFRFNNITSIPDGLFDNTPNVTNFQETFIANSLSSIPAGLFDNTPNVTNFRETFRINDLTSIPAGLFDNNPNVTSFRETFLSNDLTSIPENLFANNPNVTNFHDTFRDNDITSIPAGLFDNTPNVTTFRSTFNSNDLTSIPAGLFNNTPNVTTFYGTFLFNNDITSIPAGLFDNTPNVTSFRTTFNGDNITSIPENLFDNTPNVTNFFATFQSNNLTSIPAGLFDNTPNVTRFENTFYDNDITSIPAGLFDTQTQATNYEECFTENDLDQTSVDNVLVSVQTSADANDLNDGILGVDGGTNATPSQTGKDAADALRARGWTVNLNGY